jgi:hypothetical protein
MSQISDLNNGEVIYDEEKISEDRDQNETSPNTPQILQSDKKKNLIYIETIVPR